MEPCRRIGLDVTWNCNWNCKHCFYRHGDQLHTNYDVPLEDLLGQVDKAKAGGLNHAVLVGWGEPSVYKRLGELAKGITDRGFSWSMITNAATSPKIFERCYYEWGIDHLHISSHGNLDVISERDGAQQKQDALKGWLRDNGLPFRTNVTLQKESYLHMVDTIQRDIDYGSLHLVMLGFLPHYEWNRFNHVPEAAVHPAVLRPYIERCAEMILDAGRYMTIRYHPLCHLDEKYWPYVVNARYVFMDNMEWNYTLQAKDMESLWEAAKDCGDRVACQDPCRSQCSAFRHCGGYNKHMGFADSLSPITTAPNAYAEIWDKDGGLIDLNPATRLPSILRDMTPGSTAALATV